MAIYVQNGDWLHKEEGRSKWGNRLAWSKLKAHYESQLADSVKGRVAIRSTSWRPHKSPGRACIEFDGETVLDMCCFRQNNELWRRYSPRLGDEVYSEELSREVRKEIADEGIFSRYDFGDVLHLYMSLGMDDILAHSFPLVRALGMLDKRLGKRRLRTLAEAEEPNPAVRKMLDVRLACEGMRLPRKTNAGES